MIGIVLRGPADNMKDLGERLCAAMVGEDIFIDNKVIINYTQEPGTVSICIGTNAANEIELDISEDGCFLV